MPDLQTALEPSAPAAPAPAPIPQSAPVAPVSTSVPQQQELSDPNTQTNDFIEVDGRRPPTPTPAIAPKVDGKYKDLDSANKGYAEMMQMYSQATGRTANTVEKLQQALADLPTQLAQLIAQQLQPKAAAAPAPTPQQQQASRFKFSIDELSDPDMLATSLERQLTPLLGQQPQFDQGKLVEGLAPKIGEIIQQQLAAREEAQLRTRAESEVKALVDAGNDAGLVQAAVAYAINQDKNVSSVAQAWKIFQNKFPQMFAAQKAEDIMGELAGQRQQVPRDLGAGVNVVNADSLRTAFDGVRKYKFASQEFL